MTLGDGKRKVWMLLDEYSVAGTVTKDPDIDMKMNDFFDIAQKDMAQYKRIIRQTAIEMTGGSEDYVGYDLPQDFAQVFRIWKNGRMVDRYPIMGGKIWAKGTENTVLTLEYFAVPTTITPQTGDDYVFEVDELAANCLPFFVAAQQMIPDLVVDYGKFLSLYNQMKMGLDVSLPTGGSGGGVRQTFFA